MVVVLQLVVGLAEELMEAGSGDTIRLTTWDGSCSTMCRLEMGEYGGSEKRMQIEMLLGTARSCLTATCKNKSILKQATHIR